MIACSPACGLATAPGAVAKPQAGEATDFALKYGKDLKRDLEMETWKKEAPFMWSERTKESGWGWMDTQIWDDAIKVYSDLGLMKTPITSADAMTQDILKRVDNRPKR